MERSQLPAEISLELSDDFVETSAILLPACLWSPCALTVLETHSAQSIRIAHEHQRPDRTFECRVQDRVHRLFLVRFHCLAASLSPAATAYGLPPRYLFSNSSRVHIVPMSVMRSTARIPSR